MSDSLRPYGLQPSSLLCPWGFSRQEYCRGSPCPPPGNLPNPGIELASPGWQAGSLPLVPPGNQFLIWNLFWISFPLKAALCLHWSFIVFNSDLHMLNYLHMFSSELLFMGFSRQEYWSGLPFPESRLLGKISITSDKQMTPPLWQKAKKIQRTSWWKWKRWVKKLA